MDDYRDPLPQSPLRTSKLRDAGALGMAGRFKPLCELPSKLLVSPLRR